MPAAAAQVRQAIYLSLLMVTIASTAAVATKFASSQASTEAIANHNPERTRWRPAQLETKPRPKPS